MRNLWSNEQGNVAILFGLAMMPIALLVGSAVDYGRMLEFRDFARTLSDSAALKIADADVPDAGTATIDAMKTRIQQRYGGEVSDVSVTGQWIDASTYQIRMDGGIKVYILPSVPGVVPATSNRTLPVGFDVKVVRIPPKYQTQPPSLSQLSPEAADYNRIYMYCYDPKRKGDSDKGRTQMTAIADNGDPGLDYSKNAPPACGEGELVSYKLRNVRNARSDKKKWDDKNQEIYEYYTDTSMNPATRVMTNTMTGGRVYANGSTTSIDMQNNPILETILCDNAAKCKPKDQGGILPNNHETNRTPGTASGGCAEGKMMYYGWEDRPPNAGSDKDYDDIRIIVTCPKMIKIQDKQVHITE